MKSYLQLLRIFLFSCLIVFSTNSFVINPAYSVTNIVTAKKYSSVEAFVTTLKTIRVVMDDTPGYGNQTASINFMNWLRKAGFRGVFEVIYPGDVKSKMITLFGLPNNIPDDYYETSQNIRFLEMKSHINRLLNKH